MKSYFRFLSRNKLYTFINIAGLVVSLMFIILMGDYTWRQYSIDSWHKNADRICLTGSGEDFFMWPQAAQEIKEMCPEIEQTCCVMSQNGRIKYGQALVIWLQLNHLIHAPLGFNTERLYYVNTPEGKSQTVRSQLEKMPFVESIGEYSGTTFVTYSSSIRSITNGDKLTSLFLTDLDSTAFALYGLDILKDYGNTSNGYYLNEDAKRRLELTDDDREMVWGKDETAPISGILKDFHRINVLHEAEPFAIRVQEHVDNPNFLVKTNGDKQAKTAFVEMMRELGVPEEAMEWSVSSLEEGIAETFEDQQNTLKIITLFTIIAVIISVMGYVGMSLFFIRQRQKEIGIRKVMGSTSGEVMVLMLRMFSFAAADVVRHRCTYLMVHHARLAH